MHTHKFKKAQDGEIFKFCPCGKRKKASSVVRERKKLQRKAESLWREIVHLRDGEVCMVKKVFPGLNINHSNALQVDHFFPRADRNLFFEPSNATLVCSTCNYLKSNGSPQSTQIHLALHTIVTRREGEKKFYEMCEINNRRNPNIEWGREHYLRSVIAELETAKHFVQGTIYPESSENEFVNLK